MREAHQTLRYVRRRRIPLVLWPIVLLWRLATAVVKLIGILSALAVGAILMGIGWLLISTLAGAIIGVPLFVVGLLLVIRALY